MYSGAGFWGSSTLFPVSLRVFLSGGPGAGRVTFSVGLKPTLLRFLLSEDPGAGRVTFSVGLEPTLLRFFLSEDPGAGRVTFSVAHTEAGKFCGAAFRPRFPKENHNFSNACCPLQTLDFHFCHWTEDLASPPVLSHRANPRSGCTHHMQCTAS